MKKLTLLLSAIAISLSSISPSFASFKDVAVTHPNYDAINYLQGKGMVGGYPDGSYKADITINRVEFTKIIVEAMFTDAEINACTTSAFSDVPTNEWFTKYVCIAEKNNIIDGYPDGTFQSAKEINLAEASKIIVNAFKYPVQEDTVTWYKPYIMKLEELKALPTSLTGFEHLVKRGEMAEVMFRLDTKVTDKASTTYANLDAGVKGEAFTADEISDMAAIYNDKIVALNHDAVDLYNAYHQLTQLMISGKISGGFEELEEARLKTIDKINQAKTELLTLGSFQGDRSLLDVFVKDVDTVLSVLMNEQKDLMDLWIEMSETEGDISQSMIDKEADLYESIKEKNDTSYEAVNTVQAAFATKYGFKLDVVNDEPKANAEAVNYNNKIIDIQVEGATIIDKYVELAYNTPLEGGDFEAVETQRLEDINELEQLKEEVMALEGYEEDTSLRDGVSDYFDSVKEVLENEEKDLVQLWIKMAENPDVISQEDADQEELLLDSAYEKYQDAYETVQSVYNDFAQKWF